MLQGEMRFVGAIGIDDGGQNLHSRMTHPMSFSEVCEWYSASIEYFTLMVKHDATAREVIVSVYNADTASSANAEAIETRYIRR